MSLNVAARAGRWSASHWKTATFGWIAFVVAAVVLGGVVGTKQLTDTEELPGEAGRAAKILDEGFPQPAAESVLVQSGTLRVESAAFRSGIEDVVARIRATGVAQAIENPLAPGGADPEGSGLTGLRQRVAALDGTFTVESPAGGPTKVIAELPCAS